jgi:hypothetical protein
MKAYTGIYKTTSELRARRVLTHFGSPLEFIFKDGWYEIIAPGLMTPDESEHINRIAHTIAHSDLGARPLQTFKQSDL